MKAVRSMRASVTGNTITDNTQYGISVTAAVNVVFSGNFVAYNGRDGLVGSMFYCAITGNMIRNNGTSAAATYDNISTTATSQDVEIRGNELADRDSRTARYDLNGNSQTRIVAVGNAIATSSGVSIGAQHAEVTTQETETSTSFDDMTTAGPAVTVCVGANGKALVTLSASMTGGAGGQYAIMGVAVSGASTVAASDQKALYTTDAAGEVSHSRTFLLTGLTPGNNTFTAKYRVTGGTGTFSNRGVTVVPVD